MARSIERLSAAKVSKAKPGMYCGGGGLYLQATLGADGEIKKSWIFRFALHGRERQMGLGSCGDVTLAQARKKATGYREQSRKGSTRSTRATFPGPPLWQGTPSPRASTSAPPSASRLKGPAGATPSIANSGPTRLRPTHRRCSAGCRPRRSTSTSTSRRSSRSGRRSPRPPAAPANESRPSSPGRRQGNCDRATTRPAGKTISSTSVGTRPAVSRTISPSTCCGSWLAKRTGRRERSLRAASPCENLVAGLPGDTEIPANVRHGLAVQQAGHKAKALFHHRTRFPRHQHIPPANGEKCYPCVRYGMSPMSRAAQ